MRLILGGIYNGKYDYIRQFYTLEDIGPDLNKKAVYKLNHIVRELLSKGIDPLEALAELENEIVVCDEVGCGIVPAEADERAYREAVGKLCTILAVRAERVERVIAGIPVTLKG